MAYGFNGFLQRCYAHPGDNDYTMARRDVVIVLHIISPGLQFTDRGKTRVSLPASVATKVSEVLWSIGKSFYEEGKRLEKDAAQAARHQEKLERERAKADRSDETNLKDAL